MPEGRWANYQSQLVTSKVSLISQEDQAVPVQVARSGIRAVVYGGGANRPLRVMYLDRNADIRPDDVLITSGLGGRYHPDIRLLRSVRSSGMYPSRL